MKSAEYPFLLFDFLCGTSIKVATNVTWDDLKRTLRGVNVRMLEDMGVGSVAGKSMEYKYLW